MITIYSKPNCSSCDQAKRLCESKGIEFEYLTLGQGFNLGDMMKHSKTHRSFPMVLKDGEYLGTFQDLQNELKNI